MMPGPRKDWHGSAAGKKHSPGWCGNTTAIPATRQLRIVQGLHHETLLIKKKKKRLW